MYVTCSCCSLCLQRKPKETVKKNSLLRFSMLKLTQKDIPPPFSAEILTKVTASTIDLPRGPVKYISDFNAVMDPALGLLPGEGKTSQSLLNWVQVYDLTDVWRWKHPGVRQFTCHSDSFCMMSLIDLAFATSFNLPLISNTTTPSCGKSDHASLTLEIDIPQFPPLWRVNLH